MKLDEIKNYYQTLSDKDLQQRLNEDNATGISSDNLVKVVRTHQQNDWQKVNIDDHLGQIQQLIDNAVAEGKNKKKTLTTKLLQPTTSKYYFKFAICMMKLCQVTLKINVFLKN